MRDSEADFKFYPLFQLYAIIVLQDFLNSYFWMIFYVVCVTSHFDRHSFFMSIIGLMEFSAMTVFLKFLYVLNQIFSLLGRPLHLYHTFILLCTPLLNIAPLSCSPTYNPKLWSPLPTYRKNKMGHM